MQCPKCKIDITGQSKFCSNCGASIQSSVESPQLSLTDIDTRLKMIENSLPKSKIISKSFWPRSWAIFGHSLVPMLLIYGVVVAILMIAGISNKKTLSKTANSKKSVSNTLNETPRLEKKILNTKLDFVKVQYNEDKWKLKIDESDNSRYSFNHVRGDGYALLIIERTGMKLSALRSIALSNAKDVALDATITSESYKLINGKKILQMDIEGTIKDIPFHYHGYYWSSELGAVQFLTYTTNKLYPEYENDFDEVLNGLIINDAN